MQRQRNPSLGRAQAHCSDAIAFGLCQGLPACRMCKRRMWRRLQDQPRVDGPQVGRIGIVKHASWPLPLVPSTCACIRARLTAPSWAFGAGSAAAPCAPCMCTYVYDGVCHTCNLPAAPPPPAALLPPHDSATVARASPPVLSNICFDSPSNTQHFLCYWARTGSVIAFTQQEGDSSSARQGPVAAPPLT